MCRYIFEYIKIFEYKNIFKQFWGTRWANQHTMQIWMRMSGLSCARSVLSLQVDSVTLSKMLLLGQWYYHISKTPVKLLTLLFTSVAMIDLPVLLYDINIWVNFHLFLWQQSNFIKRLFRFTLFNLSIDHLHKLISPFSIEVIIMELRLHYVGISWYFCKWTIVYWNQIKSLKWIVFIVARKEKTRETGERFLRASISK